MISGTLALPNFGQHSGCNSPRTMCHDSWGRWRIASRDNGGRRASSIICWVEMIPVCREGRAHGLLEGDRTASGPAPQRLQAAIFRRAPRGGALHRETK